MRILVIRNDKIGDFMLAWPALALLKAARCHVTVMVPAYTQALAQLCPYVDDVLLDPGAACSPSQTRELLRQVRQGDFAAALVLYSTWRVGMLLWRAGVPVRLAPATKLAQVFYNHRITQRRSRSEKPEWDYNLDLAAALLKRLGLPRGVIGAPYLKLPASDVIARRKALADELGVPSQQRWLFAHVGSGGSANNLSIEQYRALLVALSMRLPDWIIVLTAGPNELGAVGQLETALIAHQVPVALLSGSDLTQFVHNVAAADAFMAGSTGPLHMAGVLDVPTVGFYPLRRSATALRWQTVNSPARRLAISPTPDMPNPQTFDGLPIEQVADQVASWLQRVA